MKLPLICCLSSALLLSPACITQTTSSPDFGRDQVRQGQAAGAWKVLDGSRLGGYALRFQELGGQEELHTSVRNADNQDLGWVDADGRAWRYVLHGDPEWLGTGTLKWAVLSILGLDPGAELVEIPIGDLP